MLEGRACSVLGHIKGMTQDVLLWVRVVPPLFPEDKENSEILIAPRLEGLGFGEMSKRDVPVYILKILNRSDREGRYSRGKRRKAAVVG